MEIKTIEKKETEQKSYSITKNDLKYKSIRNLDITKINTFDKNNYLTSRGRAVKSIF